MLPWGEQGVGGGEHVLPRRDVGLGGVGAAHLGATDMLQRKNLTLQRAVWCTTDEIQKRFILGD